VVDVPARHLDEHGEIKADPVIDGSPVRFSGEIETEIAQLPRRLERWCPVCRDSGSVFGWEWTRWNRSKSAQTRTKAVAKKKNKKAT
jgi:hypothetical protein